jgi:hypothetical protein
MQQDEAREFAQELVKLLGVDDAVAVVGCMCEILETAICQTCPNGVERLPAICQSCPNAISARFQQ